MRKSGSLLIAGLGAAMLFGCSGSGTSSGSSGSSSSSTTTTTTSNGSSTTSGNGSSTSSTTSGNGSSTTSGNGSSTSSGNNSSTTSGNGSSTSSTSTSGGSGNIVEVVSGGTYTLQVLSTGAVLCLGDNGTGECGVDPNNSPVTSVTGVPGVTQAKHVAADQSAACALLGDGTVQCWGADGTGEIGDGAASTNGPVLPKAVPGLSGITQIAGNPTASHFCALKGSDGSVWCWGYNGDGEMAVKPDFANACPSGAPCAQSPVQIAGISGAIGVAVGTYDSCAIKADNSVWCWGDNLNGQLGVASATSSSSDCDDGSGNPTACNVTPTQVPGLSATKVAFAQDTACAILPTGDINCWGYDSGSGELGQKTTPTTLPQLTPKPTAHTFTNAKDVGCFGSQIDGTGTCVAVDGDGSVWVWGDNLYEGLGQDFASVGCSSDNTDCTGTGPALLPGVPTTGAVQATGGSSMGVTYSNGTAWLWGDDSEGQADGQLGASSIFTPNEWTGS